jgi:hypothetical protein
LRYDDQPSIASLSDLSDVRDDVFMGYNEEEDIKPIVRYKVEADISDDEIDQVVPTQSDNVVTNDDDNTLDVLYVN